MPIVSATVIWTWSTNCRFQIGSKMPLAKRRAQHVLHRLLAEVVVDAEDLALVEELLEHLLQLSRGGELVPERLLDDEPHPTLG